MISDVEGANEEYQRRFPGMTEAEEAAAQKAIDDEVDGILSGDLDDVFIDILIDSDEVRKALSEIFIVDPKESVALSEAASKSRHLAALAINLNEAAEGAVRDYVERTQ